jgi:DNA-binding XRE family transcriptional regulator
VTSNLIVTPDTAEALSDLEAHRRELGLTQEQAAHLLGTSRRSMRRLEVEAPVSPQAIRMALVYVGLRVLLDLPPGLGSNGRDAA